MAKKSKKQVIAPQIEETIVELPMDEVMGERYGRYAKEVIQNRAIPDARDGLKPVQRRIIYAMFDEGNLFAKPTKKCAHTVGAVMGKYHPHGDSSIYEALARMSQPWNLRYPLVDFQGNNGSIDGDSPAAYRYTESRLNLLSEQLVADITKNTVDMGLTFDDTSLEPIVLPARFPNLLVNGSQGIAVAVATEIPPHNMREIVDAIVYRINHKRATVADLRQFVKGPDLPTGGTIFTSEGLDSIYETGRGRIEIESKTEIVSEKNFNLILIHEIPYQTNKSNILREIGLIASKKDVDGIIDVRDESDKDGLRIAIELKKEANADIILEYLLNKTQLRTSYSANIVAIADNRPKTLNLLDMIDVYLNHQVEVITRRSKFDLEKLSKRLHIIEGLIKAISIVDQVVALIRKSSDKADAKNNLIAKWGFSNEQAEAIVMLQLYKLTNTDITTLECEKNEVFTQINTLKAILGDEKVLNKLLINDLKQIAAKYGDDRRTIIREKGQIIQIDKRDLIADEDVMVSLTRDGYIKRSSIKSYRSSGENALPGIKTGDLLVMAAQVNTKDIILAFTSSGNYLYIPVHEIVDAKWKDEGKHINYIVAPGSDEKIIQAFNVKEFRDDLYFALVSAKNVIKRTVLKGFIAQRYSRPITCMRLSKGDNLVSVALTTGNSNLLVIAKSGIASLFNENEITPISLKAAGVKALTSAKNVPLVKVISLNNTSKVKIGIITDKAHVRFVSVNSFEVTTRLGKLQHIMKSFKSDVHLIVDAFTVGRNIDSLNLNVLTIKNNIVPVLINDFTLTTPVAYAKTNIEAVSSSSETIVGLYNDQVVCIDQNIKAEEPPLTYKQAKVAEVDTGDEGYETVNLFDFED